MDLPLNISALQDFTLQNFAKRNCLSGEGTCLTFKKFWDVVDTKSEEFPLQNPKTPIVIFAENSISTLINFFAIWKAGGVVVPLNPKLAHSQKDKILEPNKAVVGMLRILSTAPMVISTIMVRVSFLRLRGWPIMFSLY